jgi:hypothetical protein
MAVRDGADHTDDVGPARPAKPRTRTHRIVVETPRAAAVDALAERTSRLGACTVEHHDDGSAELAVEYRETASTSQTSSMPRILAAVERWLRQQPVPRVTVWVDGRRFALQRRDSYRRSVVADEPLARERRRQAARTASS